MADNNGKMVFFQSRNPGIKPEQSRDFGIGKVGRDPGIWDPGIAIPSDRYKKVSFVDFTAAHSFNVWP